MDQYASAAGILVRSYTTSGGWARPDNGDGHCRYQAFQSLFEVANDDDLVVERLLQLLIAYPGSGKQVHDANLVATMLVHGVTRLLTCNARDFQRFAAVIELEPFGPALISLLNASCSRMGQAHQGGCACCPSNPQAPFSARPFVAST